MARLRAECVRTGIRDVTVTKGSGFGGPRYVARLSPLVLPASKVVRLERLHKGSVVKPAIEQVLLAVKAAESSAAEVRAALVDLVPIGVSDAPTAPTARPARAGQA